MLPEWLVLVLAGFGAYRLAYDFAEKEGPFSAYEWVKNRFLKDNWIGRGVRCFVCVSFWTALLFAVIVYLAGYTRPVDLLLVWPGLAGMALVLDKYWKR